MRAATNSLDTACQLTPLSLCFLLEHRPLDRLMSFTHQRQRPFGHTQHTGRTDRMDATAKPHAAKPALDSHLTPGMPKITTQTIWHSITSHTERCHASR